MTRVTRSTPIAAAVVALLSFDATAAGGPLSPIGRVVSPLLPSQPDRGALSPAVSADGGTIVFTSSSTNFPQDPSGALGVFVLRRATGAVTLVSRTASGVLANGNSYAPSISRDGRYVAFETGADNLAPGADSSQFDVLRVDLQTGAIARANQGLGGAATDQGAYAAAISGNGRYVAYTSLATNIVGGDTNGDLDIFLRDMDTGTIERVSVSSSEAQLEGDSGPLTPASLSDDGRYVVFVSGAVTDGAQPGNVSDVYVRDRVDGTTTLVSRNSQGQAAVGSSDRPSISPSGRFVVFRSSATNLGPVGSRLFVRDRLLGTTTALPLPAGASNCGAARLSDLGEALYSCVMNLSQRQTVFDQVFFWRPGTTPQKLSASTDGGNGNGRSGIFLGLSAQGTVAAWDSAATNLIGADTNQETDVFVAIDGEAEDVLFRNGYEN